MPHANKVRRTSERGASSSLADDTKDLDGPVFVRLAPMARAPAGSAGSPGSSSLASTLEWLPSAPHDLLLVSPHPASNITFIVEVRRLQ